MRRTNAHGKMEISHVFVCSILLLLLIPMIVLPAGHAAKLTPRRRLLSTSGASIIDTNGQPINLMVVNYRGLESPYRKNDEHHSSAYAMFARDGFNAVRVPVAWAWFEPEPGTFSKSYLSVLDQDVAWAAQNHLYVIIDMHQVCLSPWFSGKEFGGTGNGFPIWAVSQYAQTEDGLRQAWSNFWVNDTLQNHFINVWVKIAKHYAGNPVIAGYDLLNEPHAIGDSSAVAAFYDRLIAAIRAVDPDRMIILEPAGWFGYGWLYVSESYMVSASNIVWSPHFYTDSQLEGYGQSNYADLQAQIQSDYNFYVLMHHQALWYGEFGAYHTDSTVRHLWLHDAMTLFRQYQVSGSWWAYVEDCMAEQGPESLSDYQYTSLTLHSSS